MPEIRHRDCLTPGCGQLYQVVGLRCFKCKEIIPAKREFNKPINLDVLKCLFDRGPISAYNIYRSLGVERARVYGSLNGMRVHNLVETAGMETVDGRRRALWRITPAGKYKLLNNEDNND